MIVKNSGESWSLAEGVAQGRVDHRDASLVHFARGHELVLCPDQHRHALRLNGGLVDPARFVRAVQRERRNVDLEAFALGGLHLVGAEHHA
jgi:hypothetical protein